MDAPLTTITMRKAEHNSAGCLQLHLCFIFSCFLGGWVVEGLPLTVVFSLHIFSVHLFFKSVANESVAHAEFQRTDLTDPHANIG